MTEKDTKIDGRTKRALDMAISRKQVSQESYHAVLAGEITLQQAKVKGRDGAPAADTARASGGPGQTAGRARGGSAEGRRDVPPRPVSRISKDDRTRLCMCGCGNTTHGRFAIGHDQRLLKFAYEHLRGERELTEEQLEYVTISGKLARARKRLEKEEHKNQQKSDS